MSLSLFRAAAVAAVLALTSPTTGLAAARPLDRYAGAAPAAPEGVQPGLFDAQGRACVKQCPDDRQPCDPPNYKHADGRCTTQWR